MRRTTLKDIAQKTALDVSTVSRVLNCDTSLRISHHKREEVCRVADEMGYVPHRSARSLRLQRNFVIGYTLSEHNSPLLQDGDFEFPVVRVRVYGLEEALSKHGYMLSLLRIPLTNPTALQEKVLQRNLVDGLIYNCYAPSHEALNTLHQAHLPVVLIDPFSLEQPESRFSVVSSDRANGVRLAMEHLKAQGHRQIAFVSSNSNVQRYAGYRESVARLGLASDPRLIKLFDTPTSNIYHARAEGYRVTQELLQSKIPFTAIQAGSDATATGVIDALQNAGRRVPEEVAVVGYDDVEGLHSMLFSRPFLSTVRDPNFEMGVRAAELLIAQIEEGAKPQLIQLQPHLVVRHSA